MTAISLKKMEVVTTKVEHTLTFRFDNGQNFSIHIDQDADPELLASKLILAGKSILSLPELGGQPLRDCTELHKDPKYPDMVCHVCGKKFKD